MSLLITAVLIPLLVHFNCTLANAGPSRAPILLAVGEQRILENSAVSAIQKFSVGSDCVRAAITGPARNESILIKGIKPGTADLWIWKADGSSEQRSIQVVKWIDNGIPPGLLLGLSRLNELEVIASGSGVLIRGEIKSETEAAHLAALMRAFSGAILNQALVSPVLLDDWERRLRSWMTPYRERIRLERLGQRLWLRGSAASPEMALQIENEARAISPLVELDVNSLPDHAATIYFRVYLMELKREDFHTLGLTWPDRTENAFRISLWGGPANLQGPSTGFSAILEMLAGNGAAKILSNPEMVVRAPGEAELFAGGEFPIRTMTRFQSSVNWKAFGLLLKLKVAQVSGPMVRLDIQTEVSHLDSRISGDGIPGIRTNRMKTQVDAGFGNPLLLCGLLQENMREQVRGLPLLKDIPILGYLFGSEDYLSERSELVAVLIPNAAPPPQSMNRIEEDFPKGPVPAARNWIHPQDQRDMKRRSDYPWNAFL